MDYGSNGTPSRKSCYNFRVVEINRVVDGDTIDVTIDLGFDLFKKERVRVAGVDTPEKGPETWKKRSWELRQRIGSKRNWMVPLLGMTILLSALSWLVVWASMVASSGGYIGDSELSLNEIMIEEGYAWAYDGGTKQKNFEELREIRRAKGTLI